MYKKKNDVLFAEWFGRISSMLTDEQFKNIEEIVKNHRKVLERKKKHV